MRRIWIRRTAFGLLAAVVLSGCAGGSGSKHAAYEGGSSAIAKVCQRSFAECLAAAANPHRHQARRVAASRWAPSKAQAVGVVYGYRFVRVSHVVRSECRHAADVLGYPVPCPTALPAGFTPTPSVAHCTTGIVFAQRDHECEGEGRNPWDGWLDGSSQVGEESTRSFEHLVMQGAPRVVRNPARAIDGPAMLPGSRVQSRGAVTIHGQPMHWYLVPAATNIGSAFMHHLVLVWTAGGHTYAYGFHVVTTIKVARALDLELAFHLRTVEPR